MKVNNGQYIVMLDDKVIHRLGTDHEEALKWLYDYYRHNKRLKPEAYLVQVQAMLEYPEPTITTIAHERME